MDRLDDLRRVRLEKLARLRERGENPYPTTFVRTHLAHEVADRFPELEEKVTVILAGRLMSMREMGKTAFGHLQDGSGRIQIYFRKDGLGEDRFALLKLLDLGDFIGVSGIPFRTRTGEISIRAESVSVLCKAVRPLPVVKEKDGQRFDDVTDKELRYRQRHVDLLLNPQTRRSLEARMRLVQHLRRFLDEKGFLEVETPVLQVQPGGANARPFVTHHNALSMDLFLRISLELHLKRLMVGGIERVYELARVFRNEGMDRGHNPEFTLLEFYWAYADYNAAMDLVEEMVRSVAQSVAGTLSLDQGGTRIDLAPPFRRVTMAQLVRDAAGIEIKTATDETIRDWLVRHGEALPKVSTRGALIEYLFDAAVVASLVQPTFVCDHPRSISPLAKAHRDDPVDFVERFELFIGGREYANAFSELNDPIDQRQRLEEQAARREMGDDEAQFVDEEFLTAIEHGMPPAAGVGIGVDRLAMLLTGETSIRDVIFFPHLRLQEEDPDAPREES